MSQSFSSQETITHSSGGLTPVTFVPKKIPQYVSTIIAGLGSFGLGNVMSWTSPSLPDLISKRDLGDLTTTESSWIASLAVLGALISGPIAGWCINKFGRRITMLGLAIPFLIGWLVMMFAQNVAMMCSGRFLTGFAAGAYTIAITVYVSETIQDSMRGTLGSVRILMLVNGMLFTYVIGALVSWFWLTFACALVPVVLFIGLLFLPESPRYLFLQQNFEGASQSLMWFRGARDAKDIEKELESISKSLENGNENNVTFKTLLRPEVIKPCLICFCLPIFQQLGGINGVTFFTVEIFKSAEALSPNISTIIFGIVQVLVVFLSLLVVDKIGRVFLLASSFFIMSLSLGALGTYFYLKEQNIEAFAHLGWLPLTSIVCYSISFSFGAGPVVWLLLSEILPPHIKGHASGAVTLFSWSLAFIATKTFQDLALLMGWSGSYWLYGGICIVGAAFTCIFVPETKGKTTEEILNNFVKTSSHTSQKECTISVLRV